MDAVVAEAKQEAVRFLAPVESRFDSDTRRAVRDALDATARKVFEIVQGEKCLTSHSPSRSRR